MTSFLQTLQLNALRLSVLLSSAVWAEATGNSLHKLAFFSLFIDYVWWCYITNHLNNIVDSSDNTNRWTYRQTMAKIFEKSG